MTMKIGDDVSLPPLTTEQIEGKETTAKGEASAKGLVIEAAEPGSAESARGALGFTETMPEPDHGAVQRAVDAIRQYHGLKRKIEHGIHKVERDVSHQVDKIDRKVRWAEDEVKGDVRRDERKIDRKVRWAEDEIEGDVRRDERKIDRKARWAEDEVEGDVRRDERKIDRKARHAEREIEGKVQNLEKEIENKLRPLERKIAIARDIVQGTVDAVHLGRELDDIEQMQQVASALCAAYEYAAENGDSIINIRISDTGKAYASGNTVYITPQQAAMLRKDGIDLSPEISTNNVPSLVGSIASAVDSTKVGALAEDGYRYKQMLEVDQALSDTIEAAIKNGDNIQFEISDDGHAEGTSNGTVYLTPEQYMMLQNAGVDVSPNMSISPTDATNIVDSLPYLPDIQAESSSSDLTEKAGPGTVLANSAIAERLISALSGERASGHEGVSVASEAVVDAVLSVGTACVSGVAKEGSISDWPGAAAIATPSADQLQDAFSEAQQAVVSDLTSKADSEGDAALTGVPPSNV